MKSAFVAAISVALISQGSFAQDRSPASFDDEINVIERAIEIKYGAAATDFEYRMSYNPLVYLGNGVMRILKPITRIDSDRVREYEVMHRVFFRVDGQDMDCYGMVREMRGQPGTYFVNVGTCNQGFSELFNWTEEFSTFVSVEVD